MWMNGGTYDSEHFVAASGEASGPSADLVDVQFEDCVFEGLVLEAQMFRECAFERCQFCLLYTSPSPRD